MSSSGPQVDEIRDRGRRERLVAQLHSPTVRRWAMPAWLVVVAFALVGLHVAGYPTVGPVDELQHIDYLYRSPAIVSPGDSIGQDAMHEEACRGLDSPGFVTPPCESPTAYDPRAFQELGYNTASINTPLYYTLTKVAAVPLRWIGGMGSLVTAGRMVGGLWLGLGLVLAYAAGRRLGIGRLALGGVLTIFACAPGVLYPSATITPDAASFAAGAGVFLACLYWEAAPRRRWPLLAAVTALVLLVKMTNVMVLLAAGLYVVIRLVRDLRARRSSTPPEGAAPTRGGHPWVLGGIVIALTTLVVLGSTLAVQGALSHGPANATPMSQRFAVSSFPKQGLIDQIGIFLTPLGPSGVTVGNPNLQMLSERAIGALFLAGLVAAALLGRTSTTIRSFGQAVLVTAIIGGPVFVIVSYIGQSVYVPPPGRYAATLVPVVAVLTAGLLKTRESTWWVWLGAGGLLVGSLYRLALL